MKLVFPSIEELIEELNERRVMEVRLVGTQIEHHVAYGNGKNQFTVPHLTFESLVTAEIDGKLAEVRIRHGTSDAYMKADVEKCRQKAVCEERRIREMLEARGFLVRSGILMDDAGVFFGSIEK